MKKNLYSLREKHVTEKGKEKFTRDSPLANIIDHVSAKIIWRC